MIINKYLINGIGYFGFEFDCLWDEEHGFGVMLFRKGEMG
ncbi:DUF6985 domain-containing protein [Paenibacillus sp. HWE-109]